MEELQETIPESRNIEPSDRIVMNAETESNESHAMIPESHHIEFVVMSPSDSAAKKYKRQSSVPSSSSAEKKRSLPARKTPSRPLNESDVNEPISTEEHPPQPDLASEMEMEQMEELEDGSKVEEVNSELPLKKTKSGVPRPVNKRMSNLYAPTKSTTEKQRGKTDGDLRSTFGGSGFSGSQTLKSTMSQTSRSTGSHSHSTQPRTQGMCQKASVGVRKTFLQPAKDVFVKRGPTVPVTPNFRSDARSRMHYKERPLSTEDREMLAVEVGRKAEEQRMKKTKKVFMLVKTGKTKGATSIKRSTKELTIPTTPVSYLNRRKGQKVCSLAAAAGTSLGGEGKVAMANALAAALATMDFHNKRPTQTEPFQFATDARIKTTTPADTPAAPSAAEVMEKFHRDARSHGAPKQSRRLTESRPPRLLTDARAKTDYRPKPMSTEDKAAAEFEVLQQQVFKAKPVDRRIFESMGELGVPKVAAKAVTETVPFDFRIDKRASVRPLVESPPPAPATNQPSFKARPMPSYPPEASSTQPAPAQPRPLTVPRSPKLSGGARASAAPAHKQKPHHTVVEQEKRTATAATTTAAAVQLHLTEPKEFHLRVNSRGSVYQAQLAQQQRTEEEREEAARKIKAHPVPAQLLARPFQPTPSGKELTEFHEFRLRGAALHQADAQHLQETQRKIDQEAADKAHFHARPVPKTLYEKDFEVVHEERAPLIPLDLTFESDQRACKRKEFDDMMVLKMAQLEEQKELAAKRKLDAENRRIKDLRNLPVEEGGMAFKAKPVDPRIFESNGELGVPKVSSKALTEAKSPLFTSRYRTSMAAALESM